MNAVGLVIVGVGVLDGGVVGDSALGGLGAGGGGDGGLGGGSDGRGSGGFGGFGLLSGPCLPRRRSAQMFGNSDGDAVLPPCRQSIVCAQLLPRSQSRKQISGFGTKTLSSWRTALL